LNYQETYKTRKALGVAGFLLLSGIQVISLNLTSLLVVMLVFRGLLDSHTNHYCRRGYWRDILALTAPG
jgi:hypothetical protein